MAVRATAPAHSGATRGRACYTRGMHEVEELRKSAVAGWARAQSLADRVQQLEAEVATAWQQAAAEHAARIAMTESAGYFADGLAIWQKAASFMTDPRFVSAYRYGMNSGHHMGRPAGSEADIHIEWRVHVILWAAVHGLRLPGDFVECGVNTGIYSLAVCHYLEFNRFDRDFWLFDTFAGIPVEQADDVERGRAVEYNAELYEECFELVRENFAPYPRAHLVRGPVPDTLSTTKIDRVAYLSIDMNIAAPERAALEYFWPRLVPGAIVVLDDYGFLRHELQRESADAFAASVGIEILQLPTGQGILIKP